MEEPLDLEAIEARLATEDDTPEDLRAVIAEVERLREIIALTRPPSAS